MRVAIEQTFGILKMRFQSLRELPLQIKNKNKSIVFAQQWGLVCVLLHNKLRTLGGDIDLPEYEPEETTTVYDNNGINMAIRKRQAKVRREIIMSKVLL